VVDGGDGAQQGIQAAGAVAATVIRAKYCTPTVTIGLTDKLKPSKTNLCFTLPLHFFS